MNVLILGSGAREHAHRGGRRKSPLLGRAVCRPGQSGLRAARDHISAGDRRSRRRPRRLPGASNRLRDRRPRSAAGRGRRRRSRSRRRHASARAARRRNWRAPRASPRISARNSASPPRPIVASATARRRRRYVAEQGAPIVVKADGLAAGKGVVVAATRWPKPTRLSTRCTRKTERAECVVEACLTGEEVSFFALCDGERAVPFGDAQDHKRAVDGDTGPNTGGMGAYSPSPLMTRANVSDRLWRPSCNPTVEGMRRRGAPFRGVLFAGLMMTASGPQLLEYNVRFGDPEAEVVIPRFRGDLLGWLHAAASGSLPSGACPPLRPNTPLRS